MFIEGYYYKLRSFRSLKNEYQEQRAYGDEMYMCASLSSAVFLNRMSGLCGHWVSVLRESDEWCLCFRGNRWIIDDYMVDWTAEPVAEVSADV